MLQPTRQHAPAGAVRQWTFPPAGRHERPAILFVCTANRIRSPLAEHLLLRLLEVRAGNGAPLPWVVESAGIWAEERLGVVDAALQAGRELGIDLSAHRTRPVGSVPVERFDLILGMERQHCAIMQKELPAVAARVMTVGEALSGYAFDVLDPARHAPRAIRATAKELARILNRGFDNLQAQVVRAAAERVPLPRTVYPAAD